MITSMIFILMSLLSTICLLILCTGKKKKQSKVTATSYSPRPISTSGTSNVEEAPGQVATNFPTPALSKVVVDASNQERHSYAASQESQSRELPELPVVIQGNSLQNLTETDVNTGSVSEASVEGPDTQHSSPKGRRLPAPPPDNLANVSNQPELNDMQDVDDMYAVVNDGQEKKGTTRLRVKTLEITEGSGDSSFYAKVGGGVDGEDNDLYAQVDDKTLQFSIESKININELMAPRQVDNLTAPAYLHHLLEQVVENDAAEASNNSEVSTSHPAVDEMSSPEKYGNAEYATIDKAKKAASVKHKHQPDEPPAPPIPERNFDEDDELDSLPADVEQASQEEPETSETTSQQQGPTYDKLCVRESLDHIRLRQEVEQERKLRYANVTSFNTGEAQNADVYAQIDEVNPEAVYESLSQSGSADGAFTASNSAGYSFIGAIATATNSSPEEAGPTTVQSNRADLQNRPARQHHYEQIERCTQ